MSRARSSFAVVCGLVLGTLFVTQSSASAAAPAAVTVAPAQHCVAASQPLGSTKAAPVTCFASFSDAISFATGGRTVLASSKTAREVQPAELADGSSAAAAAGSPQVVFIGYSRTSYQGNTYTLTQTTTNCGYTQINPMANGWNDNIESGQAYHGCAATLYWNGNFGSPTYPINVNAGVADLGTFRNETSSMKFCPVYVCS